MKNYIFVFIGVFLFSTLEVISKITADNLSPIVIVTYRFIIGGIVLLPFALKNLKNTELNIMNFYKIYLPGILNVVISMFFLQLAVYYGKASISAILISSNPLFVSIFARIINNEKLSIKKIIGIILGITGIILIVFSEHFNINQSKNLPLGIFFGIMSSITFALYIILSQKYVKQFGNFVFNSFAFLSGGITILLLGIIFKMPMTFQLESNNIIAILYFGIFVTGIAYIFFFEGLKHIPASNGAILFFLKPVSATILSIIFLQEQIHIFQIFGIIIVFISIYTVIKN